MSLKIGIVGLPNVGKSTIFNALVGAKSAQAANYPFCTIDPNVGVVEVPDERLEALTNLIKPEQTIPTTIEFVDIAGLVEGASKGEGLGNKFLSHIRECDAIVQVLRGFDDSNIVHVYGDIDPKRDREVIDMELILADMQTVEKRLQKAQSEAKSNDKEKVIYAELVQKVNDQLAAGKLVGEMDLSLDERIIIKDLHLLTIKPHLYIINVTEDKITGIDREEYATKLGLQDSSKIIPISARIEEELAGFTKEEAKEYLADIGIEETGLNEVIKSAYSALDLITYFTAGPKEVRAWTVLKGSTAPEGAGVIHTDFQKGFVKAEVITYSDYVTAGSEQAAKEKGLLRIEGKEYVVQDGDIMHFRFTS
ncbi:redox-regulated ATPase YchF [Candidatus Peregrinibacteria bacterium]|jgi:ribosome-binding ATPase|nr:redox-regulated ATPase YchF [Candidatus Peregrinibacteria bacterium]MBT4055620.1 redox-regulated ATPase YchF [Candidatus Peregrinibacteria bacterium]